MITSSVLVVRHEELTVALAREGQEGEEVVVVPELAGLGGGGLVLRVEGGGTAEDRVAPADDHVLPVALRHDHGVGGVGGDGGEPQTAGAAGGARGGAPGVGGGRGLRSLGGGSRSRGGGDRDDGGGTQGGTAAEGSGDDVADVLVGGGVGHLVETGVTTPETAGQGGPAAGVRAGRRSDQRQYFAHFTLPIRSLGVGVTLGGWMCEIQAD
jgi:hypothetical protein